MRREGGITFQRALSNSGSANWEITHPAVALHVSSHVANFCAAGSGPAGCNNA